MELWHDDSKESKMNCPNSRCDPACFWPCPNSRCDPACFWPLPCVLLAVLTSSRAASRPNRCGGGGGLDLDLEESAADSSAAINLIELSATSATRSRVFAIDEFVIS